MTTAKAILDTDQYVKVNSSSGSFILQSHRDTVRIAFSIVKPARSNEAFHELGGAGKESILQVDVADYDVWVLAMTDRSSLTITDLYSPTVQNPLPVTGDSVYCQDIWVDQSITTDWVDLDGAGPPIACIPFTNLHTRIENDTNESQKVLFIHFNRTVRSAEIALGCTTGGNFSNTVIELVGSGNVTRTVTDNSADDTKYTSKRYPFTAQAFNAVRMTFNTTDSVCLSNITISKIQSVNISQVEPTTDSVKTITYSHAELHGGSHYVTRGWNNITKGGTKDYLVVTPDTTRWAHMIFGVEASDSTIIVNLYEDTTTSNDGTADITFNRNRNYPNNNSTLVYENPTVTDVGTMLASNIFGAGRNSGGGGTRDTEEILLKQNTKYLFRVTEQNIVATNANFVFDWYEHTNKTTL